MNHNILTKQHIKKILTIGIIVIVALIGWIIYSRIVSTSTITIFAKDDAEIAIATEPGGEFNIIGNGSAVYKTRDSPEIFIRSSLESKQTIQGLYVEPGESYEVNLGLEDLLEAKEYYEGSVRFPFVNQNVIQGIDSSSSITSFNTEKFQPPRLDFIGIPYARKVVWEDANNFVYTTFSDEVGVFKNSRNLGPDGINGNTTAQFTDTSMATGLPLVLLSDTNIFVSNDLGASIREIATHSVDKPRNIHSDQNFIYLNAETPPAEYATELESTDGNYDDFPEQNTTVIFDYDGTKLYETTAKGGLIRGTSSTSDTVILLGEELVVIDNNETEESTPVYFSYPRDVTLFQGRFFALADHGLWVIDPKTGQFSRVFEFSEFGIGLEDSLVTNNGQGGLMFGTTSEANGPPRENKTFLISSTDLME